MKKLILFFLLIISNCYLLIGQPSIQWQKSLGGTDFDQAFSIQQTTDGGYIVAGISSSDDGDVSGNHGGGDCWIVKLDSAGSIQWQKCKGGHFAEEAFSIQQTTDGGYIFAGLSSSNDGHVSGNNGIIDCWIVKLDSAGTIEWQKCLGGTSLDVATSIQQTNGGGYIVAGLSASNDSDVSGNHSNSNSDCWIVKLDSTGTIEWQKCLGGTGSEWANSIQQTNEGGFIVAGISISNDGDVSGNHGNNDYWIVKLDSTGTIEWQKCLGGTGSESANSIQQTNEGGYVVAGTSISNDGDVSGNHGNNDYWIVKLDSIGTIEWEKSLGGTGSDSSSSIQQTYDGKYIIAGTSNSNDGDVSGNHVDNDYWIVKLDSIGTIEWQKSLGGTQREYATYIQQTFDEGYIVAGYSESINSDVTGNHGYFDYWIVKLNSVTGISEVQNPVSDFQITPNPFSGVTTLSFHFVNQNNSNIEIRDFEGRIIKNLNSKNLNIGSNEIVWDATNNSGSKVDNGLYFITISSDNFSKSKKAVVLRD